MKMTAQIDDDSVVGGGSGGSGGGSRSGGPCSRSFFLRLASFLVGCMGVGISYMVNAFNVYALSLKAKFRLSQIQLEILCSVMFLGLMGSLPGGLLLDQLGARWAAFFAGGVSVAGYVFLWWATTHPLYVPFPWLVFFFLVAGIGGGLTYIVGTAANVRNFSESVRGTIVGVIHAALSAGPGVIMLAWNSFFNNIDDDPTRDDLPGFCIFIAGSFGVINFLGVLLYDHYPPDDAPKKVQPKEGTYGACHEMERRSSTGTLDGQLPIPFPDSLQEGLRPSASGSTIARSRSMQDFSSQLGEQESGLTTSLDSLALRRRALNLIVPETPISASRSQVALNDLFNTSVGPLVASKKLLEEHEPDRAPTKVKLPQFFQMDFQLVYWPLIVILALQMVLVQNLTTIIDAVVEVPSTRDYYNHLFPYITPIFGTIAKPIIGLISDACITRIPRSSFIVVGSVLSVALWVACIFFIDLVLVILVATTLCDLAAYMAYSLGPPLLIERFGLASFSRNWALVMCGFSVLVSLLLTIFGAIYDQHATGPDHSCTGLMCFEDTCVIAAILSALATISIVAYHLRHHQDQQIIDDIT